MTGSVAVAIVGAGPYGLSIAAHLSAQGIEAAVFGAPMDSWRSGMPSGMRLKSEGFATNLSDPAGRFTLKAFCAGEGISYADIGVPVAVETFAAYGLAFQERFVPRLDNRFVRKIARRSAWIRPGSRGRQHGHGAPCHRRHGDRALSARSGDVGRALSRASRSYQRKGRLFAVCRAPGDGCRCGCLGDRRGGRAEPGRGHRPSGEPTRHRRLL